MKRSLNLFILPHYLKLFDFHLIHLTTLLSTERSEQSLWTEKELRNTYLENM